MKQKNWKAGKFVKRKKPNNKRVVVLLILLLVALLLYGYAEDIIRKFFSHG